jgi:hypothetical protein
MKRNEIILWTVFSACLFVLLCFVPFCVTPVAECDCGHDGSEFELFDNPEEFETFAGRKVRKVWFSPGTVQGLTQADFQRRVMNGIKETSAFTNTDFIQVGSKSGAWLHIYAATDEMMWQKNPSYRKPKLIPLEMQNGNWMYFTVRPRWGTPEQRIVEAAAMHGLGHRVNLGHVADSTSIMNANLTSRFPNANDKVNFAKRLK